MTADANGADAAIRRKTTRFLWLYALANAGGVAAYLPFLALLLPTRMAAVAGEARVEWLGAATLAGAVAASLSNVGWGWASDLSGTRRGWVFAGLAGTLGSYALVTLAETPAAIVGAIVLYQVALNLMLSPLAAWAADVVPDARKGLLGGLLGAGQPIGALAGVLVTLPVLRGQGEQLLATGGIVAALVLPLLLAVPRGLRAHAEAARPSPPRATVRKDLALLWLARLFIQVAGSVLFTFLLYYFQALRGRVASEAEVARLGGITLLVAAPLALLLGRVSDRTGRRRPFLVGTALAVSVGLLLMAVARDFWPAAAGYALFGCAITVHLALHSATTMQMLPSPTRRGRDLGLFNLANTFPALLSPVLAATVAPAFGFNGLMVILAVLAAGAALLILAMGTPRGCLKPGHGPGTVRVDSVHTGGADGSSGSFAGRGCRRRDRDVGRRAAGCRAHLARGDCSLAQGDEPRPPRSSGRGAHRPADGAHDA